MAKIMIGKYEATIYKEGNGYSGNISLGFGPDGKRKRIRRRGKNKTEVKDKLSKLVKDLENGVEGARDKVGRNVAELVTTPKGRPGRPSKALTLDQANAVLGRGQTVRASRLRRAQPHDRRPHRGGTGAPLGSRRRVGG